MAYEGPRFRIKLKTGESVTGQIRLTVGTSDTKVIPTIAKAAMFLGKEPEFITIDLDEGLMVVAKDAIAHLEPSDPDSVPRVISM